MRPPLLLGCFLFSLLHLVFHSRMHRLTSSDLRHGVHVPSRLLPLLGPQVSQSSVARSFQPVSQGPDQEPPSTTSKKNPKEDEELDDPQVLAFLVLGNLHRAWRLRVYLVSSLLLCAVAFVCGAFASMDGAENRNKSMLAGTVAVGGVTMGFEMLKSATGLRTSYSETWHKTFKTISNWPETHHHPWEGAVSRVLRTVTDSVTPRH